MRADGHIHTPYCPHGTSDTFEEYLEQALLHGFTEVTFTEHAPLPKSFQDPTPLQDSGMSLKDVEAYIKKLQTLKATYKTDIKINIGFEVDYIEGFEREIEDFLNTYGTYLDDSILSVHFLKHNDDYYCMDYSSKEFERMIITFGSVERIYTIYFQTVINSIMANLGPYKPNRIGHITLAHKFQKRYPCNKSFKEKINHILSLMKTRSLQLDYNGAGAVKPDCLEPYPPEWIIKRAFNLNIPIIYGSDAHTASGIGQGMKELWRTDILTSPTLTNKSL